MADELVEKVRYEADITDLMSKLDRLEAKQAGVETATKDVSQKSSGHWQKVGQGVGIAAAAATGGTLLIAGAAAKFGPMILEQGAQIDALGKKSATVFEGSLPTVQKWAAENAKSMGMTKAEVVGLAAGVGDLLKPMGFTADQAGQMSTDMLNLSGALSAWSGGSKSAAEVSDIMTAALLGERDGLKGLGISISEADVQARLARDGKDKLTGAALEQAKALATQQLIMEKSTDAQKAWADGSMDGIKAQNESKASIAQLKETLITGLYPALSGVLPYIGKAAEWLGQKLPFAMAAVKSWVDQNWPAIKEAIGQAIDGIRTGIEGFITFINDAWDKWGTRIMAVVDVVWPYITTTIGNAIEMIRGVIKVVTDLIRGDWEGVWNGLVQIVSAVWDQIKNYVSTAIALVKLTLSNAWDGIRVAASAAWDGIKGVISGAWEGIKTNVSNAVLAVVNYVRDIPTKIGDLASSFATAGKNIASAMVDGIADGVESLLSKATDVAKQFANVLIDFINVNIIGKINSALEFTIPGPFGTSYTIDPKDIPNIPRFKFHEGGVVPGSSSGADVLALLRPREMVLTEEQQKALGLMANGAGHPSVHIEHMHVDGGRDGARRFFDEGLWRVAG